MADASLLPPLRGSVCCWLGSQGWRPGLLYAARFAGWSFLQCRYTLGRGTKKINEYFAAGTRRVWALSPRKRQIHVYRGPTRVIVLKAGDVLMGDEVLPGFSVPVKRIFL